MPHGQPDFGQYTQKITTYGLSDMGELAARLGSIDTFDRRGDITFLEDFESSLVKWDIIPFGVGAGAHISSEACRFGSLSAKLTTGNVIDDYIQIHHFSPYPVKSAIGAESSFTVNANLARIVLYLRVYDGTNLNESAFRYTPATGVLEYQDFTTGWTQLAAGVVLEALDHYFHLFKLVVDFSTGYYKRLIVNETEYDMSTLKYKIAADAGKPKLAAQFFIATAVNSNQSIYVDDFILTQNEP